MVFDKPASLFFLIYLLNLTNQWLNKLSENVSFFWITALVLFCLFFHYFIVLYEILFFLEKIPSDIVPIECFEDQLYYIRPEMLHSVCIARSIRFIGGLTKFHNRKKICRCSKCLLGRYLLFVLESRGHLEVMEIVKSRISFIYVSRKYYRKWAIYIYIYISISQSKNCKSTVE